MTIKKLFFAALGAVLLCSGVAGATAVTVDYDAAISATGGDPTTRDGNGDASGNPNGILDGDELALVSWILADVSRPHHDAVHSAYTQNLAQMQTDLGATFGPIYGPILGGYMILGDAGTIARATAILGSVGKTLTLASYDVSLSSLLSASGDFDGDGQTNLQEYQAISGTGGPGTQKRADYLTAVVTAPVTPVVVNFDEAMAAANLNPSSTDGNGGAAGTPNGILDSDELAVLSFVLADVNHPNFTAAKAAYEQNLAQMTADLGAPYAAVYGVPLAGYMTLGDSNTIARVNVILMSVGKTLTLASYDVSQASVFALTGNPDGDALDNLAEYNAIAGTGGPGSQKRSDYITAVFTPYVNPECVECSATGGFMAVGSNACLRVPVLQGSSFQWFFNGVALTDGRVQGSQCQSLRISNLQPEDSGQYKCEYDDGTKAVKTYYFTLTVSSAVPAANGMALALLTACIACGAMVAILRRKRTA